MDFCEFTIGKATISVDIDADPTGEHAEGQGLATFGFDPKDVARFASIDVGSYNGMGERMGYPLGDLLRDSYDDDDEPEIVFCSNADACIMMMHAMGHVGGEFSVQYQSEGSAFWLFHDVQHARYDVETDDHELTIGPISSDAERQAHVLGGLDALRAGMPLAEVVGEIVRNESEYLDRFNMESSALESLLSGLTVTVPDAE